MSLHQENRVFLVVTTFLYFKTWNSYDLHIQIAVYSAKTLCLLFQFVQILWSPGLIVNKINNDQGVNKRNFPEANVNLNF